jgi:hypothetical protein
MIVVGIDPGITGAIAFLHSNGERTVDDMPTRPRKTTGNGKNEVDPTALQTLIRARVPADAAVVVVMENLNTFSKSGGAKSIASMQASKDVICAVLELNRIRVDYVTPHAWQSMFGIKTTDSEDTKDQSLRIARQLYPELRLTKNSGRADALLIGRYGQRHFV